MVAYVRMVLANLNASSRQSKCSKVQVFFKNVSSFDNFALKYTTATLKKELVLKIRPGFRGFLGSCPVCPPFFPSKFFFYLSSATCEINLAEQTRLVHLIQIYLQYFAETTL